MLYNGIVRAREDVKGGLVLRVAVCVPTGAWASDGGREEEWVVRTSRSGLSGSIVSATGVDYGDGRLINLTGEELGVGSEVQVRLYPEPYTVSISPPAGFLGC
jgi:hypothetical protein